MRWPAYRCAGAAAAGLAIILITTGTAAAAVTRPADRVGAGGIARSASAVPASFRANSLTWNSPEQGWLLGTARCGKKTCTDVVATTSSGRTWGVLGVVPARVPRLGEGGLGVSEIRFATPAAGWAFGPSLFATTNGGRTWAAEPIPGKGKQVLSLAASAGAAYAVVSPCKVGTGVCGKPLSLWRTTSLARRTWTRVALSLPGNYTADVAAHGRTVYVVDPLNGITGKGDKLYASTDGARHFAARPVPCDKQPDTGLVQVVASSPAKVDLLCVGNPGFSKAEKSVYRSGNAGKTYTYAGLMSLFGIQAQLAVSPSGNLAVASWSDGSFIDINDNRGTSWTMVIGFGDGGVGWNDITYATDTQAWVVYAPASTIDGLGKVLVTRDGGRHWNVVSL